MRREIYLEIIALMEKEGKITGERIHQLTGESHPSTIICRLRQQYGAKIKTLKKGTCTNPLAGVWKLTKPVEERKKKAKTRPDILEALFLKNGKVTRAESEEIGIPPSEIVNIMRRRGHVVRADQDSREGSSRKTGKIHVWLHIEDNRKPRDPREPAPRTIDGNSAISNIELETHKIPCMSCGEDVPVQVWPGEKPPRRVVCGRCKESKTEIVHGNFCPAVNPGMADGTQASSEVVTYKPGDKDFDRVAAQCTPLKKIKNKAEKQTPHKVQARLKPKITVEVTGTAQFAVSELSDLLAESMED